MSARLFMLVGLPGSGKSTQAEKIKGYEENCIILSSDQIREEMGDVNDQSRNNEVFDVMFKRCYEALSQGVSVVYDATNLNRKKRVNFLKKLDRLDVERICVLMAVPYEVCLARNFSRDRQVPEDVMVRMLKSFEIPVYQERWNTIKIVWDVPYGLKEFYDYFNKIEELKGIPHDNPHHDLTIGEHIQTAGYYALKWWGNSLNRIGCLNSSGRNVLLAAWIHDIGKDLVKIYRNHKGEETEVAHYYGHENVSCYLSLFYLLWNWPDLSDGEILHICNLVLMHMRPCCVYNQSKKSLERDTAMFGLAFMKELMVLHECDKRAQKEKNFFKFRLD